MQLCKNFESKTLKEKSYLVTSIMYTYRSPVLFI